MTVLDQIEGYKRSKVITALEKDSDEKTANLMRLQALDNLLRVWVQDRELLDLLSATHSDLVVAARERIDGDEHILIRKDGAVVIKRKRSVPSNTTFNEYAYALKPLSDMVDGDEVEASPFVWNDLLFLSIEGPVNKPYGFPLYPRYYSSLDICGLAESLTYEQMQQTMLENVTYIYSQL